MTQEYADNLKKGTEYQDFVMERLHDMGISIMSYSSKKYQVLYGENKAGFEIKLDDQMKNTDNVYIEVAEKSNACNENYVSSGIYRDDNTWIYAIGDYSTIYLLGKAHLRQVYEREADKKARIFKIVETPTSKGILLPKKYVEEKLALKVIKIESEQL